MCAPDVGKDVLNNNRIQKLLDLKNYNIGRRGSHGAARRCGEAGPAQHLRRMIDIISYEETYEADDG